MALGVQARGGGKKRTPLLWGGGAFEENSVGLVSRPREFGPSRLSGGELWAPRGTGLPSGGP